MQNWLWQSHAFALSLVRHFVAGLESLLGGNVIGPFQESCVSTLGGGEMIAREHTVKSTTSASFAFSFEASSESGSISPPVSTFPPSCTCAVSSEVGASFETSEKCRVLRINCRVRRGAD